MTDQMITVISLVIALVIGIIFYRNRMHSGSRKHRFIEEAKQKGFYTTGEYEASTVHLGNDNSSDVHMRSKSLKVKYRYQVNGVTYYKVLTFQSVGKVSVDFPISVMIYYDPHNPKKTVCPE